MPKPATLSDIARKSKVSISTVSLVLRDRPGIPDKTRQRVFAAASAVGYAKKPRVILGRARQHPKLSTLGLILKADPNLPPQANPFYSYVLAGIEQACRRNHINLLYATMPVDGDNVPVEMPRLLEEDTVDGLLLVGALVGDALHQMLVAKHVPVVLVDAYAEREDYDAVLSDNARGAHQAMAYLIGRGHKEIALVGGHPNAYPSLRERRDAYERALSAHGLTGRYFADSVAADGDLTNAITELLRGHSEITALFGVNDEAAITAIHAAQSLGKRVPQDLSVVGFDDIDLAHKLMPPLTTMHVDKIGMGRIAVQLLADRVQYPESETIITLVQPRLVERASVQDLAVL